MQNRLLTWRRFLKTKPQSPSSSLKCLMESNVGAILFCRTTWLTHSASWYKNGLLLISCVVCHCQLFMGQHSNRVLSVVSAEFRVSSWRMFLRHRIKATKWRFFSPSLTFPRTHPNIFSSWAKIKNLRNNVRPRNLEFLFVLYENCIQA